MLRLHAVKKCVIVVVIISILCGLLLSCSKDDLYITEDISQYDYDLFSFWKIFPSEIPENLSDVKFHYSKYFNDEDVYLEFKFSNQKAMDQYLDDLLIVLDGCSVDTRENPFDSNYTDLFVFDRGASKATDWRKFYNIKGEVCSDQDIKVSAHYCVVSYSYNDLCVITSYFAGIRIVENQDSPIYPHYLKRFNVDLTNPLEHYVYEQAD